MKKKYLFMATAAIMMAGCASDDLVGDENISSGETPIAFSMNTPNATRDGGGDASATNTAHTDAANALGNEFIVWGEKVMEGAESGTAATDANLVFNNYRVQYTASSANTSVSNTDDWEYVGIAPYNSNGSAPTENTTATEANACVSPSIYTDKNTKQTIKYWDDKAVSYTFTAVSAKQDDIKNQKVKITKNTSGNSTAKDKGYTIELASGASVGDVYVADRKVVSKDNGSFSHSVVQMEFRNFQSKIRFGIYETVPGYKVVITGIKYNTKNTTPTEKTSTTKGFGVDGNFVLAGASSTGGTNTSYTVTYDANNHAQVAVTAGNSQDYIETSGENWLSTTWSSTTSNTCIGETAATATYDKKSGEDSKAYTAILPNPSNNSNLKLTVKYELYSEDTGEKISVDYKTVEVPAQYCQWKSNYAYTYLFKITDKSAELYPITFDACVVESETGNQETITEVGEPSITTFAVKDGKIVTGKDEYEDGNTIYATIVEGSSLVTMSEDNIKLYTVTATGTQTISEASVANCLAKGTKTEGNSVTTWTSTAGTGNVLTVTSKSYTASSDLLNAVPSEDGKTVTLDASNKKAIKWTAAAGTYYAIEYIKTDGENNKTMYYKIVKVASSN